MVLDFEQKFAVGYNSFFESHSQIIPYGVTFEDDGVTGYFYAVETKEDLKILDALHIYNVSDVVDKDKPSKLQIVWSEDWQIVSLLINDYCHAIFNFKTKAGYCRNGFPENKGKWCQTKERILTDKLIEDIFKNEK